METRLAHARRQISLELNGRKLVERQRNALEAQMDQIRVLVTADDFEADGDTEGQVERRRQSILKNLVQRNSKYGN